ncbi:MAG TPA: hypothetical protein PKH10_00760 [bacterium]|nr:hypothetical protein [bacterium]
MRKFLALWIVLAASLLCAGPVPIEFGSVPEKKLEVIKKIPYGTDNGQVGIFIPGKAEEKPFGPNAISGDGTGLFILDNMNRRVLSLDIRTKILKKELSLPSATFDALFVSKGTLFLHNSKEERLYARSGDTVRPETKIAAGKTTVYPYTKFMGNGTARVVVGEKEFFELAFTARSLMSFLLVGTADNGDLFFQIELADGSRHILITSGKGVVLGKMTLPTSDLYKPEKDIHVAGDGTVYVIAPGADALAVYGGRL